MTRILLLIACLTAFTASASAEEIWVTIQGQRQGLLKVRASHVTHDAQSPRDPATGLPTGKRQQTVTFVKEWGAGSAQLSVALSTFENLNKVEIDVIRETAGKQEIVRRMLLGNASVVAVHRSDNGHHDEEVVSLQYEKIEITYPDHTVED